MSRYRKQRSEQAKDRQHVLVSCREKAEMLYLDAIRQGIDKPVVFALDLRDEQARMIADVGGSAEQIQACLAQGRRNGTVPTLLLAIDRETAAKWLRQALPAYAFDQFDRASREHDVIFAVAVAEEGARVQAWPVPE